MAKLFRKTQKRIGIAGSAKTRIDISFWRGAIVGFIISAIGSLLTSYFQYKYSVEQKEIQLFLDEKKEFVTACNVYLTEYRNWHELMQFYSAKDSLDTSFSDYTPVSAKTAYYKWKVDIDAAYGKMYLVSDNEFGAKTIIMSQALTKSLQAFATTDTLSVAQRYAQVADLDLFFQEHWLSEAKREILSYNSGERRQKSDAEFFKEINENMINNINNDSNRKWRGDTTYIDGTDFSKAVFPEK